ncbi:hypothetical protein [Riemerella columbina]|uniref:hypothetical protein n=1 Tax=Riemerella columbina TaxID=103810 RepID=UPI00036290D9|nr:hypothetical protein [Riemerella columbina]
MSNKKQLPEWEKEFNRVKNNSIYFLELYYNQLHPDKKVELTKEEKQNFFDKYKGVPFFEDMDKWAAYSKEIKRLKDEGYEDREIL